MFLYFQIITQYPDHLNPVNNNNSDNNIRQQQQQQQQPHVSKRPDSSSQHVAGIEFPMVPPTVPLAHVFEMRGAIFHGMQCKLNLNLNEKNYLY